MNQNRRLWLFMALLELILMVPAGGAQAQGGELTPRVWLPLFSRSADAKAPIVAYNRASRVETALIVNQGGSENAVWKYPGQGVWFEDWVVVATPRGYCAIRKGFKGFSSGESEAALYLDCPGQEAALLYTGDSYIYQLDAAKVATDTLVLTWNTHTPTKAIFTAKVTGWEGQPQLDLLSEFEGGSYPSLAAYSGDVVFYIETGSNPVTYRQVVTAPYTDLSQTKLIYGWPVMHGGIIGSAGVLSPAGIRPNRAATISPDGNSVAFVPWGQNTFDTEPPIVVMGGVSRTFTMLFTVESMQWVSFETILFSVSNSIPMYIMYNCTYRPILPTYLDCSLPIHTGKPETILGQELTRVAPGILAYQWQKGGIWYRIGLYDQMKMKVIEVDNKDGEYDDTFPRQVLMLP